jgi:RHS repeat-associated protein
LRQEGYHALALKSDGTVWAWGWNRFGQLGSATTQSCWQYTCSSTPIQVSGLTGIVAIAAGESHSVALKSDGTVWAWGLDDAGELGDGSWGYHTHRMTPGLVPNIPAAQAIGAGAFNTFAVGTDGSVWGWGYNSSASSGYGNNLTCGSPSPITNCAGPVKVAGISGAIAVTGGFEHTLALKSDGTVLYWGLGPDLSTTYLSPLQVTGLSEVTAVSARYYFSMALTSTGAIETWGQSYYGEGIGKDPGGTPHYLTPQQVPCVSGATSIAAGDYHSLAVARCIAAAGLPTVAPPPGSEHNPLLINEASAGAGVNTLTGAFSHNTDIAIAGRGPSPQFVRSANSNDTRDGPLGPGWTHSYNIRLNDPGDASGAIILVGPEGRSDRYTLAFDGSYTPPPAEYTRLAKNADGTYTATLKDQTVWTFSALGQLSRISDRFGNHSDLGYGTSGLLNTVSDPAGRGSLTLSYNSSATRLVSVADWTGRTISFGYDSSTLSRLRTVADRENATMTYAYDGASVHVSSVVDARGATALTNHYDSCRRVDWQADALGLTTGQHTTFGYGATDAQRGRIADGSGNLTTTTTYPSSSFDSYAPVVIDTYDMQGRLVKRTTRPSANADDAGTETYGYDSSSNLNRVTDARNNSTGFCYDVDFTGNPTASPRGNLTRSIAPPAGGPNPEVSLARYDAHNNLTDTISPRGIHNGASVSCQNDLSGAIDTASPPLSGTSFTYDASSAKLLATSRRYNDPDLGTQVATTKYEYGDSFNLGRITRTIPPRGNAGSSPDYSFATTFAYYGATDSQAGLLHTATDALNSTTTYAYDALGRKISMLDPNGQTWQYTYDNEDRLRLAKAPAPGASGAQLITEQRYDAVGNRTVQIDSNGQVTTYAYDQRNQLQEQDESPSVWTDPNTTPTPKIVTAYRYDNLGNLTRVTRAAGDANNERATDYTYDGRSSIRVEVQYPYWPSTSGALTTQYGYDVAGNQTSVLDPLPQTTNFAFDVLNRLLGITYTAGLTPNVAYTYDADGNRSTMNDGNGQTTYTYDELDRPLSVTSPGTGSVGYRYDLGGNRSKLIYPDNTAVTYTFDKRDELASVLDWANRSTSYQYSPSRHLTQATNFNGTTAKYTYDNDQRLVDVYNQHGSTTLSRHTYTLDSVGNRIQVAETLAQVGAASISPTTTYAYDHEYRLTSATPSDATVPGPRILAAHSSHLSSTEATLAWTTSTPATGQVQYGTTSSYGSSSSQDTALVTSHSQTLTGLAPGTTYNYQIIAYDSLGNRSTSDNLTFATPAAPICLPCSVWDSTALPAVASMSDGNAIELGVRFRADISGFISGIRFYKGASDTGTHVGNLWSSTGQLLASATLSDETASGWQQVGFSAPVAIDANTTYVASYYAPVGGYALDLGGLAAGGIDNAPLHLLGSGVDGANGVYMYSATSAFPTQTFNASNYWVDVMFRTTSAPSITGVQASALSGAGATLTWSTDTAADTQVEYGTSTGYGNSTLLNPTIASSHVAQLGGLSPSTVYHYRVKSRDASGNLATSSDLTLTTTAASTCPCSIWSSSAGPSIPSGNDTNAVELGLKVRSDSSGYLTGIRFYKGAANTGVHVGSLWSNGGSLLAQTTFLDETGSGWQQADFALPIAITAGTTYIVSYHAPVGGYAADQNAFASSGADSGLLHALANGVDGANGLYLYSSSSGFPTQTYNASNYWVDTVFTTAAPPTISGVLAGSITSNAATVVWITDTNADNQVEYGSSTSYGSASLLDSTLLNTHAVPLSALKPGTTFHYRVRSRGSNGYLALSGDGTFTTLAASCPCSIFDASTAPANPSGNGSAPVELGVKFRSDTAGYISGIRFYKGVTNTGTHIGSLWTSSGTLLANATFSAETASGWQQVSFADPVAISANTTYVASYFAAAGSFAADLYYFGALSADAAPLHALASGVDGANGLYAYSSNSTFPSQSFNSSNYWVDVVFTTALPSGSAGITTSAYGYDPVGNRLTANGTASTYDRADRMISSGYHVNDAGNLVQRGPDALGYDQANRLTCYRAAATTCTPSTATSTYAYDGDGKRSSSTTAGATTTYVYDISGGLPMLLMDGTRKYAYGLGVAYETDLIGNIQSVPLVDGLGSTRALTDIDGTLVQTYRTDPFGVPTLTQGTSTQPFGFTGEQTDPTGLVYLRARMYDPLMGRFLQRDTVAKAGPGVSGWNRYAYAGGNPVRFADPTGHCRAPDPCAAVGALIVAGAAGAEKVSEEVPALVERAEGIVGQTAPTLELAETELSGVAPKIAEQLTNLANAARTTHILQGDATGGGHAFPGLPGKSPFPAEWTADEVIHVISDVATGPSSTFTQQGAKIIATGTRLGVDVKVVLTNTWDILTGYPTNLPRNP